MGSGFFARPILNSPYDPPLRHWDLGEDGQPTGRVSEGRRRSDLVTPVPKPKKRRAATGRFVDAWRELPNPDQWLVSPETARLLQH